jgi:hypothetical protein
MSSLSSEFIWHPYVSIKILPIGGEILRATGSRVYREEYRIKNRESETRGRWGQQGRRDSDGYEEQSLARRIMN